MTALGAPMLHRKLLNDMASAQGFDLKQERATGTISGRDVAEMLERCRGCADPEGCARALDAGAMPAECANDSRWDALRAMTNM